jgi:hypothetical protein
MICQSQEVNEVHASHLTDLELSTDGSYFVMRGVDSDNVCWALRIPSECLQQLILTLPNLALGAMRRQYKDETLRVVYPADSCVIELASDQHTFILTLGTRDGFHVSFGLSGEQCESIGDSPHVAKLTFDAARRAS